MHRAWIAAVAVVTTALLAAACGAPVVDAREAPERQGVARSAVHQAVPPRRPNIVFVLMDDFSMDLLGTMRSARYMTRHGASYDNAFVVDSLCCVSRSATFTGQYPHQTGVLTNTSNLPNRQGPMGGWRGFARYGNQARTFAVRLQRAGYLTGYVGKYLNGYEVNARDQALPPTPPGWSDFRAIFGTAYDGWDFQGLRPAPKGTSVLRSWPAPPATASRKKKDHAYAGTVIGHLAMRFLRARRSDARPYFLEVAPYAPHGRVDGRPSYADESLFPPAYRDQPGGTHRHGDCGLVACRRLTTKGLPGFGDRRADNRPDFRDGRRAPQWNKHPLALTRSQAQTNLRDRARMAQSVDRMVMRILRMVDENTYVVLTSDNGFHLGQLGLLRGKGTAYDTDTHVPVLVVGPGVVPGARDTMVSNIDWAPTFEALAGLGSPAYRSGTSLVPTFGDPSAQVADYVYFEHTFSRSRPGADPDRPFTGGGLNVIPSYVAVRSRTALLVRNDLDPRWGHHRYAYELYDYTGQRGRAWERANVYDDPAHAGVVTTLLSKLDQWDMCAGLRGADPVPESCRTLTVEPPLG
ncbi:sulfatase-like hydrolase/transferase [Nocardioides islandensis]|uniref:Sulfatase-like hydrolase/transferase n=1 Tax=Nocardioides islandensis TaxID=433663 RepID=A0A930VD70_9ACTN|nr:sulfatase-like hydrolase/transferase [Nocardioides islandensis]MBF4761845.1 sulfatase-like hydrolase/transferase [Nocardioides islandensis]